MSKISKAAAIEIGLQWEAEGWEVTFYPSGLTSRSRQYICPVLVAVKDGATRKLDRTGFVREFAA